MAVVDDDSSDQSLREEVAEVLRRYWQDNPQIHIEDVNFDGDTRLVLEAQSIAIAELQTFAQSQTELNKELEQRLSCVIYDLALLEHRLAANEGVKRRKLRWLFG